MKFLHTADLHLDSAFCSVGVTDAQALRERQRSILKKIFETAKTEDCDMILIAGDLFDTVFVSPETRSLCLSLFADFNSPIIIAPGNHDAYVDGSFYKTQNLPENVCVFTSSELQYFDFPKLNTTVAGYAFTSAAMLENPLSSPPPVRHNERILLLCAHTELDVPTSRYAPMLTSDIVRHRFDYAALGHIHKHTRPRDNIVYCGFPEGRSFDEQGEGGVMIVTTDGIAPPTVERRNISQLCYLAIELSVDGACEPDEIEQKISAEIKRLTELYGKVALRIELTGAVTPDATRALREYEEKEYDSVVSLRIINSTLALPDKSFLEKDSTLRGEFYRSLLSGLYSDDAHTRALSLKALQIGLAAIDGKSFTDGGRS